MKDECFIRGKIPMTKSEVRAISLSKLELKRDSIIYDIGAGTGSVSVEAALAAPEGHVYAFEQKEEGCDLIRQNRQQFGITNLTVIPGKAPESILGIPAPDRVFLGGTGGNLEEILDLVRRLNPQVRIVINMVSLETLAQITDYLKKNDLAAEIVSVQIARARQLGGYHLMEGLNPVYVITIEETEESDANAGQLR